MRPYNAKARGGLIRVVKRVELMESSLFLICLLLSFAAPEVASQTPSNNEQKQILLQIKREWGGEPVLDSWHDTTTTSSSSSYCDWPGVGCAVDGSIVNITLSGKITPKISRRIPDSLCRLRNLALLDLSYNNIPGPFPATLYNCSSLRYLDISQNRFVGATPADVDHLSPRLTHLDLSSNNFSGDIPPSIGRLPAIQELLLVANLFDGSFPAEIGNLSGLQTLALAYNPFAPTRIPSEFGNLTKLTFLWMTKANLEGEIPTSFGKLAGMIQLDLAWNKLTGAIPAGIWGLPNLQKLYLYINNLSGSIVIDGKIGARGLVHIDIATNKLNGSIPQDFGHLPNLTLLSMYNNRFSGDIPASIGLLPSLTNLRLFNNSLTGALPPELGKHSQLWNMEVADNMISGELPEGLCDGGALVSIIVFNNNFSGKIPPSLGKCPTLTSILFYLNRFSEELPDNLCDGGALASIRLFSNNLTGKMPPSLGRCSKLTDLNLRHNRLNGEIPASIGLLPMLSSLDLSSNELSGVIPSEIGNLNLDYLNLSFNQLSGEIPAALQIPAYYQSFLSNPSVCASSSLLNIPTCSMRDHNLLSRRGIRFLILVLSALVFLLVATMAAICTIRIRRKRRHVAAWTLSSFQPLDFTESNILNGITEENLIGAGGAGKVYRIPPANAAGEIVAVKKIWNGRNLDSRLEKQFQSEVHILGSIRHKNIVKLLCCISSVDSKLLVYEYMENGSLDRWLHRKPMAAGGAAINLGELLRHHEILDWPTRLEIAIGSSRGLCYMHHDCSPPIIHRDVKSSNILLDSEFNARVADFGLARMLVKPGEPDTVSVIAGSFGYMAPECGYCRKLNEKVDVYSFGVVLLELTTGREARNGDEQYCNLAEWAWRHLQEGREVSNAIDPDIRGSQYTDDAARMFKLGIMCTETSPSRRPSMKEVLQILEWCKRT